MKRAIPLGFSIWGATLLAAAAAEPLLRVVKGDAASRELLENGGFERTGGAACPGWAAAPRGFRMAAGEGRNGSAALRAGNQVANEHAGASQTLSLERKAATPLVIRGWSKALGVTGGTDSGYSLYVDIVYTDGTPLWGQTGNFRCGSHDWQEREFVILPEKPVKSLTLHCILRGHAGTAWFDDVSVREVTAEGDAVLFQGVPVVVSPALPPAAPLARAVPARGLFLARDVAAGSDFFGFDDDGVCQDLGLKLSVPLARGPGHARFRCRLTDTAGKDRAITLVHALPVDAGGGFWGDDIRRSRALEGRGEFTNQVAVGCGATGTLSLYPLGPVWNDANGLTVALDMACPAQYRVGYQAGLKWLFIAFDLGLVEETKPLSGGAELSFTIYQFAPGGGFRGALDQFMKLHPDFFAVRSKEQGLWMPFTDVSTVQDWQDFRFRYHEGDNNVPWDDAHGVLSFRYTEPMTWWMSLPAGAPRTAAEALRARDELARGKNARLRQLAGVTRLAAMHDESGQPALQFHDTPWCNGAVWSLNPNPFLSGPNGPLNAATIHWNREVQRQLYGPDANGRLDGEYLDSLEGYVTADLNFRRDHFGASTVPLTFSSDTKRPALWKALAVAEFTRWIAADVHRGGHLLFANGVPYRFTFLCPWLDVLGTETDWLRDGRYAPAPLAQMDLWRAMSGAKPYLLLMNTDYDRFGPGMVENYFQRCLFHGMWPGFFSHNAADNPYWRNPAWYNRDRPLFKKYLPLVERAAEAGWQPLTKAACDNPSILLERFGPAADGAVYLTIFNDTASQQAGSLTVEPESLRSTPPPVLIDLVSGQALAAASGGGWHVSLSPQAVALVRFAK